jgi:2-dehydropantoate 2-reductase
VKICFFGAGAIGCFLAGHLTRLPGCSVSVVARGAQLDALRRDGLEVQSVRGTFRVAVQASDRPDALGVQDYLFITLKANQLDAALASFAPLIGESTVILPPTTGLPYWFFDGVADRGLRLARVDPDGRQRRAMPPSQVLGCVYWMPVEMVRPGVVRQHGGEGSFPVGEPDGSSSMRAQCLSAAMTEAGLDAPLNHDIRSEIWMKTVSSLCLNPLAVLTQASLGEIANQPAVAALVPRLMQEADALALRLGITPTTPIERRVQLAFGGGAHRMSMLQDLERGRPLEFESLQASFEDMRALAGLPTPTLDVVMALMVLRARTAAGGAMVA